MDDQAVIRTYGNINLPEGTPDRPLVTFALFAYNQEKYVREAVNGAFSQTYWPLEIILSDDCSSDRTFEIIEEMAQEYQGPHLVKLRRGANNLGIIDHVLTVGRLASGVFVVVAAGDDISVPSRTQKCLTMHLQCAANAVYSGRTLIDDSGNELGIETDLEPMAKIQDIFRGTSCAKRYGGKVRNIPGYSAAYERDFLAAIPLCGNKSHNEDALTTVLLNIVGANIEAVNEPLVRYRLAETSVSHRAINYNISDYLKSEEKLVSFCRSSKRFYPYLFKILQEQEQGKDIRLVRQRLEKNLREADLICNSSDCGFFSRLVLLLECRRLWEMKLVGSRLFGKRVLAILKQKIG